LGCILILEIHITMFDFLTFVFTRLLKAWQRGTKRIRWFIIVGLISACAGVAFTTAGENRLILREVGGLIGATLIGFGAIIILGIVARERLQEEDRTRERIEKVEERARQHPDRPQLAWDLARTKLENYLDRNLGQLRSIFWLTSFVMIAGFGFILYGLTSAFERPDTFPVSVVASASGVLISFIGGSFLLIYRSILTQARRYVTVLERINAVGMAVQVLGAISKDNKELRNQSTADLAKQLIELYSTNNTIEEEQ
jgi:hypothetical protein